MWLLWFCTFFGEFCQFCIFLGDFDDFAHFWVILAVLPCLFLLCADKALIQPNLVIWTQASFCHQCVSRQSTAKTEAITRDVTSAGFPKLGSEKDHMKFNRLLFCQQRKITKRVRKKRLSTKNRFERLSGNAGMGKDNSKGDTSKQVGHGKEMGRETIAIVKSDNLTDAASQAPVIQ